MATQTRNKQEKIAGYQARITRAETWIKYYKGINDDRHVAQWQETKDKLLGYIAEANSTKV